MTVAISVTVMDGVVLATDSAASVIAQPQGGAQSVAYVYENANKIFQLHRGLAIGAMSWGIAAFGDVSVETIFKDFREEFMSSSYPVAAQAIAEVAKRLRTKIFDEHYTPRFGGVPPNQSKPQFGAKVSGFSPGSRSPESWTIQIDAAGNCPEPVKEADVPSIAVHATPRFLARLLHGMDPQIWGAMKSIGIPDNKLQELQKLVLSRFSTPIVHAAMPIKDAIDLAEFLTDITIKMVKFLPGPPVVGGPIEIAAITKHERFKWIRRKHYYSVHLNPPWNNLT